MDDIGAEELSKLSTNPNSSSTTTAAATKIGASLFDSTNTNENVAKGDDRCNIMKSTIKDTDCLLLEGDSVKMHAPATSIVSENIVANSVDNGGSTGATSATPTIEDDSDGKEKTDATPENLKKIDDVISATNYDNELPHDGELKIVEDESPTKQCLAFTIDFGGGESSTSAAAAAKYRNMVERFQNRHKRGASMSKLDEQQQTAAAAAPTTPTSARSPRVISAHTNIRQPRSDTTITESGKVKLRIRERSTSGVRDANKRHSWSPRSSTHESFDNQQKVNENKQLKQHHQPAPALAATVNTSASKKSPVILKKHDIIKSPSPDTTASPSAPIRPLRKNKLQPAARDESSNSGSAATFTPRSTAMQMALNKIEFLCPEPPLEPTIVGGENDSDSVSETGTYTLDGDNYTEEQKEIMNIDKNNQIRQEAITNLMKDSNNQSRPNDLPLLSSTSSADNHRRSNILEVNYYHDSTSLKPKISYLEKIKSRVRNISKSPEKKLGTSPSDLGTFTSVTTSGILSKKPTLDSNPKFQRKNSLTTSQIDSSAYICADTTSSISSSTTGPIYPSAYTDHQKAEYKLNLFTSQKEYLEGNSSPLTTPESPIPPLSNIEYSKSPPETTALKTAQTKNDWIQEWARNVRARSCTSIKPTTINGQMSRSYDCEGADSVFNNNIGNNNNDPSINYRNKPIDRFRNHAIGDMEYSSDTNVSSRRPSNDVILSSRPPLSPSRIPSPMHSIGRSRTTNGRNRGSLQDLSPGIGPDTDVYLQKTAVAISNLAQSLSRKNSLQSCKSPPSVNNSPRRVYSQQHYSADEFSPTHAADHHHNGHHHHGGVHKRNLSLDYRTNNMMSHSLNNDTLTAMLDYRNNQRPRQNSFDTALSSPVLRNRQVYIDQTGQSIKQHRQQQQQYQQQPPPIQQQQNHSPLRRSSSFSVKPIRSSMSRNNEQKPLQTTRTMQKCSSNLSRTGNAPLAPNPIQKSASSTSFRKMYSDYDDNVAYYINDEDDLVDEYCSSDEYDNQGGEYYVEQQDPEPEPEPLTNTRYNKALLMRIERSKQKLTGSTQNKPVVAGVMACPNTPEMPRRTAQNTARASMRQSVPRDSSLNRLRGEVPNSLASAKKQLLQTANAAAASSSTKKIQPKYMDISKYKSNQGASFLRKDESKSTLVTKPEVKRSPSASVFLNRADPTRTSNRSVKSAGGGKSTNSSKRDTSVSKQKEADLAMWKRRATYDPMKAAAEGRKKQEEAKKSAQGQHKSSDSSVVVLRSQSFHSGVGTITNTNIGRPSSLRSGRSSGGTTNNDGSNRWTLTSTESSGDEDEDAVFLANKEL